MAASTLNLLSAIIVGGVAVLIAHTALSEPAVPLEPSVPLEPTTQPKLTSGPTKTYPIAAAQLPITRTNRRDGFDHYQQALASAAETSASPIWLGSYIVGRGNLASEILTLGPKGEFAYYLQGCLGKINQTLGQYTFAAGTISLVAQPFASKFASEVVEKPPYENQYSSMPHEWQMLWWLDDAGQRSAPFLLPAKSENDLIAELRGGCFDPERVERAGKREVDARKFLRGQPELTPAQRARVLQKAITAHVLAIHKNDGSGVRGYDLRLTLDRGAREGVFVGDKFDFPFRVISVLENSAVVEGIKAAIDVAPNIGDALTSSAPGTLIRCPDEPN